MARGCRAIGLHQQTQRTTGNTGCHRCAIAGPVIHTNLSKACRSLSSPPEGHLLSLANVFETSSHTSHVPRHGRRGCHLFSLVLWLKPTHVLGSILSSPLPKVTHIFSRLSCIKEGITDVAMITMSMSLASIIRDLCPCFTACWA